MKLLTKTTIYYLVITLGLFVIGGMVFYTSLRNIIDENIAENLEQTQEQVLGHVRKTGHLPPTPAVGSDILIFQPSAAPVATLLKDTVYYSEFEEESLPYRELIFSVKTQDGLYTAIAGKPIVEKDDLIESVASSLGIVAGILLAVLFLLNWVLSKSLWKPFYKTLDGLRKFDVSQKEKMMFDPANTEEFRELNTELEKMTEKIRHDYQNLKEFTENASHEIQTPLAIIRSKLELMIQAENLSAEQMKPVQDIYESANRLSKLNQSLLLLTKIENRQFHETKELDVAVLAEKKLEQLEELIQLKGIRVEKKLASLRVKMNPQLADILLSNIISNAIRHNVEGGTIAAEIKGNSLMVSNSGTILAIPSEKLFGRFQKASPSADSIGLGLSIVKQICDTYGFKVSYSFSNSLHTITLTF